MNRQTRPSPFGALLQTLESHADRIRREDRERREHQRRWIADQNAKLPAADAALQVALAEMNERAKHEPKPKRPPIRARFSLADLNEGDVSRASNYPNYKWVE